MKIVFFTDHFVPEISAPAAHIFDRCKIWVQQGHNVIVVTNVPNYPLGEPYEGYKNRFRSWERIEGINVLRVGTYMAENKGTIKRTLDYISFAFSSFINSIFLERPDIVYSTSPHIFAPLGGIAFSIIKQAPHILEVRDIWPESIAATTGISRSSILYKLFELLEKFIYRASKKIIVFTNSFKENLIEKGVQAKKLDVVINGAKLSLFNKPIYDRDTALSLGLEDKFVVGYMGTHGLSHDLLNAIRAGALLKGSDVHFLFLGEGAEKDEMISLANVLKASNIHFLGRKSREELPKYWSICNIGLVHLKNDPAFEKVIPSKIFETMAAGRPIVYCGPESDGSRLITKYDCGIVSKPEDPEELASKIMLLKNNTNLYKNLASNGERASHEFSREKQAEKTLNVFSSVIKKTKEKK